MLRTSACGRRRVLRVLRVLRLLRLLRNIRSIRLLYTLRPLRPFPSFAHARRHGTRRAGPRGQCAAPDTAPRTPRTKIDSIK
ncbi:hypothetical protein EGY16_14720 [Burkholderia pseudomallei]|nr:hypothetical protein EGY16_14720 [Burkholderia pseudomallei]